MPSFFDRYDARFLLDDPAFESLLSAANDALDTTDPHAIPGLFDGVPLDVFAMLALYKPDRFPKLAQWLPVVPEDEFQTGAVGSAGQQAFLEAAAFVRTIETTLTKLGRRAEDSTFLDYGICWARLSRLLYKYTATSNLYGVDAWPASLSAARDLGFRGRLALVDIVPKRAPFDIKFDVVFAFSVLTHVSEICANAIGETVADALKPGGLFIATVRPGHFVEMMGPDIDAHRQAFRERGFTYQRDQWAIDGDIDHFGNTIIAPGYLKDHWPAFDLLDTTVNAIDPFQLIVILKKRG